MRPVQGNQGVIPMIKKRDDLLAKTLHEAGLLSPLMNVMVEQIESESKPKAKPKSKKRKKPVTAARQFIIDHFPDATEEEIDMWEGMT